MHRNTQLGVDGVNQVWRDAKLKGAGIKRARTLVSAAEHSIGNTEAPESARIEIRNLLNDYEVYKNRMDALLKEIEAKLSEIPYIDKLMEIKGIGLKTVSCFIAEVGDIRRFDHPKQLQKLAGYAIVADSSGKHNGESRISHRGRKRLRYALYEAAISVIGKNKEFREIHDYYRTRKQNPLKKMQSVIAIACKLIRIFYTILEERSQYENWIASVLEGRTVPVTEEDYEKLIGALNVLEKEIYQGLNKLLLMIERSADKNEIIDRWMDKLVERYKKQKDLFYNILGNQILLKANCRNSAEFYQKEMLTVREAAQKVLWNDYQRLIRIDKERGKDTIQTGVRRLNGLKDDADVNAWHYEVYFFEKRMPDQLRRIYKSPQYTGTMEPSDMFAEFVSKSLRYHLEWNS